MPVTTVLWRLRLEGCEFMSSGQPGLHRETLFPKKKKKKKKVGVGGGLAEWLQWWANCLARVKSSVQTPVSPPKKGRKRAQSE
jgi:hypothetical protein